jgi:hypothetical protein
MVLLKLQEKPFKILFRINIEFDSLQLLCEEEECKYFLSIAYCFPTKEQYHGTGERILLIFPLINHSETFA